MGKKSNAVLEVPVAYGSLSVGDKIARIPISIRSADCTIEQADRCLRGRQLAGRILARPEGVRATQPALPGFHTDIELVGTFEVDAFRATPKAIGATLKFSLAGINVEKLTHFANREGMLRVDGVSDLPESRSTAEEEDHA